MPRPSTGTVKWRYNPKTRREQWMARFTRSDKSRTPWCPLDPTIAKDDEAGAKACALGIVEEARSGEGSIAPSPAKRRGKLSKSAIKMAVIRICDILDGADRISSLEVLTDAMDALVLPWKKIDDERVHSSLASSSGATKARVVIEPAVRLCGKRHVQDRFCAKCALIGRSDEAFHHGGTSADPGDESP